MNQAYYDKYKRLADTTKKHIANELSSASVNFAKHQDVKTLEKSLTYIKTMVTELKRYEDRAKHYQKEASK